MCIVPIVNLSVLINVNLPEIKKVPRNALQTGVTVHTCVRMSSLGVDRGISLSPLVSFFSWKLFALLVYSVM
jgi:putative ubiquitin-RnfH superfamily antitoxin RatB of RatAB toxin-antitoxin module